jgi:hypothetical protein
MVMRLNRILLAMIDRPTQAMAAVTARPRSWWLPALLVLSSLALLTVVSAPQTVALTNERQAVILKPIVASLPEDQAALVMARSQMTERKLVLSAVLGGGVVMAIGWLVRAGVVHLSALALGGQSTWAGTFAAAGVWSMLPDFARNLVQTLVIAVNGRLIEHQGLSFLAASGDWLQDGTNLLYAFLAGIDPFTLWHLILLSVAVAVAAKLSTGKSITLAVVTWAVFTGSRLLLVAISSALGTLG